jgi:hypothetical protein
MMDLLAGDSRLGNSFPECANFRQTFSQRCNISVSSESRQLRQRPSIATSMPLFYAFFGPDFSLQQANLPLGMQTALFSVCTTAAALLMGYLLLVRFPGVAERLSQAIGNALASIKGHKREARLNKVVCYHCNKGMGLYNPIYTLHDGEQHIEGTCSLCGGFVRVRLN